ncbi:hypothetical protein [Brachybacterium hainanense]|uniref:Uncharacterized protein n=1 Tax=Brachybacterium hainanense TaxID=1541174 RepID=A0ABV6R949_9MICO
MAQPPTPNVMPPRRDGISVPLKDPEADERWRVILSILPLARDRAETIAEWVIYGPEEEDDDA